MTPPRTAKTFFSGHRLQGVKNMRLRLSTIGEVSPQTTKEYKRSKIIVFNHKNWLGISEEQQMYDFPMLFIFFEELEQEPHIFGGSGSHYLFLERLRLLFFKRLRLPRSQKHPAPAPQPGIKYM